MKNRNLLKNTMKVALMLLVSAFASSAVVHATATTGTPQLELNMLEAAGTAVLFGAQCYLKWGKLPTMPYGMRVAGIDQELWVDRIVDPLFADDSVLSKVQRVDDQYILGGAVVHIPQAGAQGNVVKNRAVFPGVVVQRTDTDVTYPLDVYTTDPVLITDAEAMQISYKKMDSVLKNKRGNIKNVVTTDLLHIWAATGAAQILRTTGADSAASLAPSATGTRKKVTYADLVAAMNKLNEQDVPDEERYALFDAAMYGELLTDPEITKMSIEKLADRAKGVVAEVAGFKIMKRSKNTLFTNAGTPVKKAPGAAAAATDNRSVLIWQRDHLNAALGEVKFYETLQSAEHYGDIYSALLKAGGRQERNDGLGVLSLVQAHGA